MRQYRVSLKRPNKRYAVPQAVRKERIIQLLKNVWRLRFYVLQRYGVEPVIWGGDQMPLHRSEQSDRNTMNFSGIESYVKEDYMLSRERVTVAEQFKSVFTVDDEEAAGTLLFGPSYPPIRDLSISVEGVKKLLKGVNPRKAAGPDQVPCRLLQALHEELAQVFTLLFQKTYEEGSLPDVWKTAWITPIYKKDAKCLAANYRPVSLTCVSCTLFEHILASHIRNHLDEYGILYTSQHGFRKKLSCESQLLYSHNSRFPVSFRS